MDENGLYSWKDPKKFDLNTFTKEEYELAIAIRSSTGPANRFWHKHEFEINEKVVIAAAYSMALGIVTGKDQNGCLVSMPSAHGSWSGYIKKDCITKLKSMKGSN